MTVCASRQEMLEVDIFKTLGPVVKMMRWLLSYVTCIPCVASPLRLHPGMRDRGARRLGGSGTTRLRSECVQSRASRVLGSCDCKAVTLRFSFFEAARHWQHRLHILAYVFTRYEKYISSRGHLSVSQELSCEWSFGRGRLSF